MGIKIAMIRKRILEVLQLCALRERPEPRDLPSVLVLLAHAILVLPELPQVASDEGPMLRQESVVGRRELVEVEDIPFPNLSEVVPKIIAHLVQRHFRLVVAQAELAGPCEDPVHSVALLAECLVVVVVVEHVQVGLDLVVFNQSA